MPIQSSTHTPKPRLRGDMYLRAEQRHREESAAAELTEFQTLPVPAVYPAAPAFDPPPPAPPPTSAAEPADFVIEAPAPVVSEPPTPALAGIAGPRTPVTARRPVRPTSRRRGLVPAATFATVTVTAAMGIVALLWPATGDNQSAPAAIQAQASIQAQHASVQPPTAPVATVPAVRTPPPTPAPVVLPTVPAVSKVVEPGASTRPRAAREVVPATRREPAGTARTALEGQLRVTSNPAGARVTVNGIGWGPTPVTIGHLPLGTKTIRLTYDGYASQQRIVEVRGDRPSAALHVTLNRSARR